MDHLDSGAALGLMRVSRLDAMRNREATEFRLETIPVHKCFYDGCFTPPCGSCETCDLSAKLDMTAQWFPRAGELSKRRFLSGIVRRFHSVDLLQQISRILQPTTSKDYTYSRSRIMPSLVEDMSTQSSDRALDREGLRNSMLESWDWFALSKYWTKVNYALGLLQMCDTALLHLVGNLIRLLILRKQVMGTCDITGMLDVRSQKNCMSVSYHWNYLISEVENDIEAQAFILNESRTMQQQAGKDQATKPKTKAKKHKERKAEQAQKNKKEPPNLPKPNKCKKSAEKKNVKKVKISRPKRAEPRIVEGTAAQGVSSVYAKIVGIPVPKVEADGNVMIDHEIPSVTIKPKQTIALVPMYAGLQTEIIQLEERNVFCGPYNVLILKEESNPNRVIDYTGGELIATGSSDKQIRLLDIKHAKELPLTIQGHTAGIKALVICESRGFVLSGSYDLSIRQWNLKNGNCLNVFRGHIGTVTCLALYENKIVSGGKDCQVKVWNLLTGKTICNFMHSKHILAVKINDKFVVSCCEQGIVKVWTLTPPSIIKILEGHHGPVTCLSFDHWHLVSGSKDTFILAWSMIGKYKHCLMAFKHPKEVLCLEFVYMRVISGCKDGKIRIFDLCNANCLRVLRANSNMDAVLSLSIAENRIVVNTLSNVLVFYFEDVKWDYTAAAAVVAIVRPKDKFSAAPLRKQPHSYVRAQRMKRIGSTNEKIYRREEDEAEEGVVRLSHHSRSLSKKSMELAKNIQIESLKLENRRKKPCMPLTNLESSVSPASLISKSPDVMVQVSPRQEIHSKLISEKSAKPLSVVSHKILASEKRTLERIKKRGPHRPRTPDQIYMSIASMQRSPRGAKTDVNTLYNISLSQEWGPRPIAPETCKAISTTSEKLREGYPDTFNARGSTDGCVCIKTFITPFEVREQELKPNFSLHRHDVKCFIPKSVLIRSKSAQCYVEPPFDVKTEKIRPQTAVDDENNLVPFGKERTNNLGKQGMRPNVSFDKLLIDKRPVMDPYRNRSGFYLRTLAEQQEYTERIAQSHSKSREKETELMDKASRKAWLRRVKGLPVEYFTKDGILAAAEFGSSSHK